MNTKKAKQAEGKAECGTLHEDAMFLRVHVGSAKSDSEEYDLATGAGDGAPLIQNTKTGKTFQFTWEGLIRLAKARGL